MSEGANELEVLHPERTVTVAGVDVTVREPTFVEGMRIEAQIQPLLDALVALAGDDGQEVPADFNRYAALFSAHWETWLYFMAVVTGQDRAWLDGLTDHDGRLLSMTVWAVNANFFSRRVVSGLVAQMRAGRAQAGARSTPH